MNIKTAAGCVSHCLNARLGLREVKIGIEICALVKRKIARPGAACVVLNLTPGKRSAQNSGDQRLKKDVVVIFSQPHTMKALASFIINALQRKISAF